MLKRGCAIALFLGLVTAVPAGAATSPATAPKLAVRWYTVTSLTGKVTLAFHGSAAEHCAAHGVCGVRGTETYELQSGKAQGVAMLADLVGHLTGTGSIPIKGLTTADVTTAGAPACHDSVAPAQETVSIGTTSAGLILGLAGANVSGAAKSTTIFVGVPNSGVGTIQSGKPQTSIPVPGGRFDVSCTGPRESSYSAVLPRVLVHRSAFLAPSSHIALTGTRTFKGAGFSGTIASDVHLTLSRRACPSGQQTACTALDHALRG